MISNTRVLRTEIITNCKVCNETINAYLSYGALACPSCRVFFRRQTSTQQPSLNFCLSNRTCKITKETRTNCQYCRYQKCLNIGMDPERIQQGKNGRKNRFYGKYISQDRTLSWLGHLVLNIFNKIFVKLTLIRLIFSICENRE